MQSNENKYRNYWLRLMAWRTKMISSIESLEEYEDTSFFPEEKAISYATWAIAVLLFLGMILIGCLWAVA